MSDDAPDWRKAEMVFEAGDPGMSEDFPDWVKGVANEAEAAAGGFAEGDYTSWTLKWVNKLPDGLWDPSTIAFTLDDKNDLVTIEWQDNTADRWYRFGIFNLADFSQVFLSTAGQHYSVMYPRSGYEAGAKRGYVSLDTNVSISLQTYLLLCRNDGLTIEVWRAETKLWTRDVSDDEPLINTGGYLWGIISITGKWVLILGYENAAPWDSYLLLYKGS